MFQGNASEEELQTVVETIESKLKDFQHTPNASIGTFQAEDVLKSCFSHDDDYLIHEIQRVTQHLLPNDHTRQTYQQINSEGYENYVQQYQQNQQQQSQQQFQSQYQNDQSYNQSLQQRTEPLSTTSDTYTIRRSSDARPSSARTYRTFRTNQSIRSYDGKTTTTTTTKKKRERQDQKQKNRRLEIQKREMEKRKAIEKQIRASQLARYALRKTTRKKMT
jgi:hypothetical protein